MLTRLGKFEILRPLAQGSMGEVYLGRDPYLGREVAIKVIHTSSTMGAQARERFAMEARAAGALNHPNIVTIHEMGEEQGVLYLAMELVKGEDLGVLIQGGTLAPRDVLEVMAQVCDGLAFAHRHHVLHRDIKPSNIKVAWEGARPQAKILDFGVAKMLDTDTTDEGTVLGTVNYMAPEYLQSGRPDARSDLFAVGVILYEALTGVPPFDGSTPGSVVYRILHDSPAPLPSEALVGISRDLQAVVHRALSRDPAGRFQTAEELSRVLREAQDPEWRWDGVSRAGAPESRRPSGRKPGRALPQPELPIALPGTGPQPARRAGSGAAVPAIHRELLQTTLVQLERALELDPGNVRAHALRMVTLYRLGRAEALRAALQSARDQELSAPGLLSVPRFRQMAEEEAIQGRLPLDLHEALVALLDL